MTAFLLGLVVGGGVAGDLLKAHAMRLHPDAESSTSLDMLGSLGRAFQNPWFVLSLLAYTLSFVGFMALLSFRDVSFAVPATALGYALETFLAGVLLSERVGPRRWAGACLVIAGVWLLA